MQKQCKAASAVSNICKCTLHTGFHVST